MAHDAERAREPRKLRTPSANGSRYLAISFVTAAALVPIGWGLGASEFYASHSRNAYDALGASAFSVEAISADVVFIGDSSLLTGVRTRQFEKETGLSAYSLALPAGMMYRAPELLLDKYLAANSRPRLIVLYMGAWSQLDSRYQKSIGWFEGVSMLARYAPPPLLWDYVRHQPSVILEYPYLLLSSWWSIFDVSTRPYHALVRKIGDDKGYLLLGDPVSPATMNDNCEHDRGAVASDRASVGAFRARYRAKAAAFAVYIAPMPACASGFPGAVAAYKGIADVPVYSLPSDWFLADDNEAHLTKEAATANTSHVARFVLSFLAEQSPSPDEDQR